MAQSLLAFIGSGRGPQQLGIDNSIATALINRGTAVGSALAGSTGNILRTGLLSGGTAPVGWERSGAGSISTGTMTADSQQAIDEGRLAQANLANSQAKLNQAALEGRYKDYSNELSKHDQQGSRAFNDYVKQLLTSTAKDPVVQAAFGTGSRSTTTTTAQYSPTKNATGASTGGK